MTQGAKPNWKWLHEIANKDCGVRTVYRDGGGKTCFIGALADELGFIDALVPFNTSVIYGLPPSVSERLSKETGLTLDELSDLQSANDNEYTTVERRRQAVREELWRAERQRSGRDDYQ